MRFVGSKSSCRWYIFGMTSNKIVVILGVGPGLGQACGKVFASKGHPVALLSRSAERLNFVSKSINEEIGDLKRTRPYGVDVTKREEIETAFEEIKKDFAPASIHTVIFNAGGFFQMKPFLESSADDYRQTFETQCVGAVHFFQLFIKSLQETTEWNSWQNDSTVPYAVGNLLVSGATAAVRGSARWATVASSSFALRAITQSIAREFGPQGIHVAHFILDGVIETERTNTLLGRGKTVFSRMDTNEIAQIYYNTAQQKRSVWSFETDLRPAEEKWYDANVFHTM